jgi:DNA primase
MDNFELASQIAEKYGLKRSGNRFSGPCPKGHSSKSSDCFSVWFNDGFVFKCYSCNFKGGAVKWLREMDGKSCPEAHELLGLDCSHSTCPAWQSCRRGGAGAGEKQPSSRRKAKVSPPAQRQKKIPVKQVVMPSDAWRSWASAFVSRSAANLAKNEEQLHWLAARGIDPQTASCAALGWNPHDVRVHWADLGLQPEAGKEKYWIPAGLVIPIHDRNGNIYRIRIRRPSSAREKFLPELKYCWIKGSGTGGLLVIRPGNLSAAEARGVVVVEAELDGWAIAAAAGDVIVAALGTVAEGLPASLIEEFSYAKTLLIALDADAEDGSRAGQNAAQLWEATFRQARYYPVPQGKDPGDFVRDHGGNIKDWLAAGLPPLLPPPQIPKPASSLPALLPADDAAEEVDLGTVGRPADTGLSPEEERTARWRYDWVEWVLGFGPDTEQMAKVRQHCADYGAYAPANRQPYLDITGSLKLPYGCPQKYRYWDGGQSLLDTLLELGAADKVIDDRITMLKFPAHFELWQQVKKTRRRR